MKETIAFYKRQIFEHGDRNAIGELRRIQHPEITEALFEMTKFSEFIGEEYLQLLSQFVQTGDPRASDIVIDYLQSCTVIKEMLLAILYRLDDPRIATGLERFMIVHRSRLKF